MAPCLNYPVFYNTFCVAASPQLMWSDILVICSGVLLALSLLMLVVVWHRRLSRWVCLSALLPLTASVATEIVAHNLFDSQANSAVRRFIAGSTGLTGFSLAGTISFGTGPVSPQLVWASILMICSGILLALSLLILAVVWHRHLSWRVRICALLPLGASVAAEIAAHHLFDTYISWAWFVGARLPAIRSEVEFDQFAHEAGNANQWASVLGWFGVVVTGILLIVAFLSWRRLVVSRGPGGQLSASFAVQS